MASAKTATKPAKAEPVEPTPIDHAGPEHDWRNPEAVFEADDHCPNAELARIDRAK